MDTQLNNRFRAVLLALSAALTVSACDVGPVEPVGRRPIGLVTGGGGPLATTTIDGTWRRTLVFFDDFGFMHSSETTWTFDTDGTAERSLVTTNITLGASDTIFTAARWRIDGTNVVIEFVAPTPGTITLAVRVQGTTLFLAGQEYERVS